MLERVLEPEVMESQEEAIAYDDMDHSSVNQQFVTDLLAHENAAGEILDLGTGTARIPILLCAQSEDLRVHAVDLSVGMLDIARVNIELTPYTDRILLDRIDAKRLTLNDNQFDVVISNSIVHHIPSPESTLSEAVRVCKPGGLLFFRDLLRPESDDQVHALVNTYAGDEVDHARQMFDDSLRAAFTVTEIQTMVEALGFAPSTVSATSDRHWTWSAVKPA